MTQPAAPAQTAATPPATQVANLPPQATPPALVLRAPVSKHSATPLKKAPEATPPAPPPAPLVLSIDPFKAALTSTTPQVTALASDVTPPAPLIDQTPGRAQFVPLFKKTDNADDPNNHGRFMDNHEFGIELRSNF